LPYEKLVQELRPDRNLSVNPLFQVMFVLQSSQGPAVEEGAAGGEAMREGALVAGSGTARFDCTLSLVEAGGRLTGLVEYNADLFDATTIRRLAGHFQVLLQGFADDPARRLSELSLLTEAERRQLAEWNDTDAPYPVE